MLIILIHNDSTGNENWGNYDYEVRVNKRVIETGRIEKHYRPAGWKKLVERLIGQQVGK